MRQIEFRFRRLHLSPEIGDARGAGTISINRSARNKETATEIHPLHCCQAAFPRCKLFDGECSDNGHVWLCQNWSVVQ
jgi:hypothetical protein